jgi:RNA polymerase subunit RPABC4/transcription elongation factor Spt4
MSSEYGEAPWWDRTSCNQCYMILDKYGYCPVCDVEPTNDEEE